MKSKHCRKCNRAYPIEHFPTTKSGNRRYICHDCEWMQQNERKARSRAVRFQVDVKKYEELHRAQYGRCAICGEFSARALHMDHDHATGVIRELLCSQCNVGLGMFKDDITLLKRATEYLTKHKYKQQREAKVR